MRRRELENERCCLSSRVYKCTYTIRIIYSPVEFWSVRERDLIKIQPAQLYNAAEFSRGISYATSRASEEKQGCNTGATVCLAQPVCL